MTSLSRIAVTQSDIRTYGVYLYTDTLFSTELVSNTT